MATTEKLLIFANSEKKGDRCVAGKRLTSRPDNRYDVHEWIRPIHPRTKEGEVPTRFTVIAGRMVRPLDVVEITFDGPANNPHHPEDWNIVPEQAWKFVHSVDSECVPGLCDDPGDLWGGRSHMTERVPEGFVPKMEKPSTLLLVQPQAPCRVHGYMKPGYEGRPDRPRAELLLPHQGVTHTFSVTDTAFLDRYNIKQTIRQTGRFDMAFADPSKVAFCLSLTPAFMGNHYKIAAAIIELK